MRHRKEAFDLVDAALFAGLGLISFGAWLAWHPAGFIVGGVLVVTSAILVEHGRSLRSR